MTKTLSMTPSMNPFLIVTIVEIHILILDVCVSHHDETIEVFQI